MAASGANSVRSEKTVRAKAVAILAGSGKQGQPAAFAPAGQHERYDPAAKVQGGKRQNDPQPNQQENDPAGMGAELQSLGQRVTAWHHGAMVCKYRLLAKSDGVLQEPFVSPFARYPFFDTAGNDFHAHTAARAETPKFTPALYSELRELLNFP